MSNFNFLDFVKKKLTIDCPHITLTKVSKVSPKTYTGSGSIFQNEKGELKLKFYSEDNEVSKDILGTKKTNPGKIIPSSEYYNLSAKDMFNHEWQAFRVRPYFDRGVDVKSLIFTANLHSLFRKRTIPYETKKAQLTLSFDNSISLDCVRYIENGTRASLKENFSESIIADFFASDYEFIIRKEQEWLAVDIISKKNRISERLSTRACEALQFILSKHISMISLEKYEDNVEFTKIYKMRINNYAGRISPPIDLTSEDSSQIWNLFKMYFEYVNKNKSRRYHKLSSYYHSIIKSSQASIEAQGLTVGVTIEGVLSCEFSNIGVPDKSVLKEVDKALRLIKQGQFSLTFRNRLTGNIGSMKTARAKDRLVALNNLKVINRQLITAWGKLRNKSAHPESENSISLQKYINLCYTCQTLFNQLVFLAIGYKGKYVDFSSNGWSTKKFSKSLS